MPKSSTVVAYALAAAVAIGAVIAVLAQTATVPARADTKCAAACNAAHDQCLASSHDRYSCDSQRNQCLKSCGGG